MEYKTLIETAAVRIRPHLRETPLEYSYPFSHETGCEVYLKMENVQITGSFKARGALNKILSLPKSEQKIVTASTGNHGLGVANALGVTGRNGTIFLPLGASPAKVDAIRMRGVPVEFHGTNSEETERYARAQAEAHGDIYVSPYNDEAVMAGQGTIGVELIRQLPDVDVVLVSVGGGGLIGGIAAYLKAVKPSIQMIGCLPANAPVMYECLKAGHIFEVPEQPTLSDATAGGLEAGSITFDICKKFVDDYVLVSEAEIAAAMKRTLQMHHWIIEGSAGVSIAALQKSKDRWRGKRVVSIICGGNVSESVVRRILEDK